MQEYVATAVLQVSPNKFSVPASDCRLPTNLPTQLLAPTPSAPVKLTPAQQKLYAGPFPKPTTGKGTIKISSPPLSLEKQIAAVQHFNPKGGKKEPQKFGRLNGFKPVQLPVVFHCKFK
jgi:hypothetical protein